MKQTGLRQILSQGRKHKQNRFTLCFAGNTNATAVAAWLRRRAWDPKVLGSNPGVAVDATTIKTERHLRNRVSIKGTLIAPSFWDQLTKADMRNIGQI